VERNEDILALDEALTKLEKADSRAARVVELRFFGGLEEANRAPEGGLTMIRPAGSVNLTERVKLAHLRGFYPPSQPSFCFILPHSASIGLRLRPSVLSRAQYRTRGHLDERPLNLVQVGWARWWHRLQPVDSGPDSHEQRCLTGLPYRRRGLISSGQPAIDFQFLIK
jgi:hypothetical protein